MKQLIQNFKSGDLYVDEVPMPSLSKGTVLVENKFSLISAGTERGTVKVAKASLIGKAKQRPDLVKQVLQQVKKNGLKATLELVRARLDSPVALGYSTSGIVHASLDTNNFFKVGDRVACAGQNFASHAEIVSVPQNLVVKIPDNVSFEDASYTTLGAIALQGVRQAEPTLGENVCVIGLGLLGQITCQLLKANGCNVFGIDISKSMVELAEKTSADKAMLREDANIMTAVENFTNGRGFDSVIITAATKSPDPINFSAEVLKKKGKVIAVGAVNLDVPRDPHFYRKELDLRLSCSYGPGRYDVEYEEKGHDYPYAYVRWTEQRNMEAFLNLASKGLLNLKDLTTHIFDINDAEKAYDLVLGKVEEPSIGILLKYNDYPEKFKTNIEIRNNQNSDVNIGFIGAGNFAQSFLVPHTVSAGASLETVITSKGITSKNVADKFKFNTSSTNIEDVLSNEKINTVFIATQHNTHADYTVQSLKAGKNVFVEKPLAMNYDELQEIIDAYSNAEAPRLLVGFNRRFSPVAVKAKSEFINNGEPLVLNMRVNAGFIPKDHWTQNEELGGGRIIGEICHFIDLMQFFTDSKPIKVFAECIDSQNNEIKNDDNIAITVKFENGSVGNLVYLANGDKALEKERIEIFSGKKVFIINDFKGGAVYSDQKMKKLKIPGKGHKEEVYEFIQSIKEGKESPISFESICYTTLTTFKIIDSLNTGLPQEIL